MAAQRIAILGGGLMGHGIAQVFACGGPSRADHRSDSPTARDAS